ncbi:signal peptidase I [Thermophilibacter provencensis]|uniref:Signal peptidase I n=1 Tax=Thermophilibacter provencensis TaxID=1852386 RepID=A0ABT7V2W6_9ACTN|nr:signal peptidase I [Thermophilibacter provencensis]MDM8270940.1 signal peptidase I [Thermophilibacter provencensis]
MSEGYEPRHAAAPNEPAKRGKRGLPWPVGALLGGIAIAVILRLFVIGVYYVPSGSMLNTIHEGDLLLGEMVSLHFDDPRQGDVVTFDSPLTEGETLVKRVIAVGGQTIDLVDGTVYVDGEPLVEPYTEGKPTESLSDYLGSAGISYPYVVPEGTIWVMGDNRTNSKDSRFFGPVSVDDVTSRVLFIYWPLSHVGTL